MALAGMARVCLLGGGCIDFLDIPFSESGARGIGLDALTGRIAAGLTADLLFVEGDPLNDLEVLLKPVAVMTAGRAVGGLPHTELLQ